MTVDIPAIILAVAALVTALTGLIAGVIVAVKTGRKLETVHSIVNSKSDAQLDRIDQLTVALVAKNGVDLLPMKPEITD